MCTCATSHSQRWKCLILNHQAGIKPWIEPPVWKIFKYLVLVTPEAEDSIVLQLVRVSVLSLHHLLRLRVVAYRVAPCGAAPFLCHLEALVLTALLHEQVVDKSQPTVQWLPTDR